MVTHRGLALMQKAEAEPEASRDPGTRKKRSRGESLELGDRLCNRKFCIDICIDLRRFLGEDLRRSCLLYTSPSPRD